MEKIQKPSMRGVRIMLALIVILYVIGCNLGCSSINKATNKVLTNEQAFNKVGNIWARLNPCVNDSSTKVSSDTTQHADTTYEHNQSTPQIGAMPVNTPGLITIHDTTTRLITKYITIHDSTKTTVIDGRQVRILNDTINAVKRDLFNAQNAVIKAKSEADQWKATAHKRWWIIFFICLAAALFIVYKIWRFISGGGAVRLAKGIVTGV